MSQRSLFDPFAALMPTGLGQMPVVWRQLCIPGPPPALELSQAERSATTPDAQFARRTIQRLDLTERATVGSRPAAVALQTDRLALIDKASPHALFDLMLTEVSPPGPRHPLKPDPNSVLPITGRVLWQTAANFQRFISSPEVRPELELTPSLQDRIEEAVRDPLKASPDVGLDDACASNRALAAQERTQHGWLQLSLNCDPNTNDRESVQALKSFHLHLIYWRPAELQALSRIDRIRDQHDPYLARQCLDPLSFIAPELLYDRLADLKPDLDALGAQLLPADASATCAGQRAMGCLIELPSWGLLATPAFEHLVRQLHQRLTETAAALMRALTGLAHPPAPWQRHRLLPAPQIARNLEQLGLSIESRGALLELALRLHDLPELLAERLRHASPARRMHRMTLNQPCYSLSLSPMDAHGRSTMGAKGPLLLSLQVKLFSGIGGAGLISLPGIPSVRVLRGQGRFSEADWQRRAEFQRRFAACNSAALLAQGDRESASPASETSRGSVCCGPIGQFQGAAGWTQ